VGLLHNVGLHFKIAKKPLECKQGSFMKGIQNDAKIIMAFDYKIKIYAMFERCFATNVSWT
jgi:hypothetical protein